MTAMFIEEYEDLGVIGPNRQPLLGKFIKSQALTPSGSAQTGSAFSANAKIIMVWADVNCAFTAFDDPGADANRPTAATATARRYVTANVWRPFRVSGGEKPSYITV